MRLNHVFLLLLLRSLGFIDDSLRNIVEAVLAVRPGVEGPDLGEVDHFGRTERVNLSSNAASHLPGVALVPNGRPRVRADNVVVGGRRAEPLHAEVRRAFVVKLWSEQQQQQQAAVVAVVVVVVVVAAVAVVAVVVLVAVCRRQANREKREVPEAWNLPRFWGGPGLARTASCAASAGVKTPATRLPASSAASASACSALTLAPEEAEAAMPPLATSPSSSSSSSSSSSPSYKLLPLPLPEDEEDDDDEEERAPVSGMRPGAKNRVGS